ncbi:DUF4857 domain-containing protein [Thioalkalicoccus limnaeus]|uniref:DUF4857 domain-containing protein n=1 Tax=Thioalkalicoccus limnaeus TaxID=120681 RepID=A0ABV4BB85_9GAMM
MTRALGWLAMVLLLTVLSAIVLPRLYEMAFARDIAPTYLFFSPVAKTFIFREHRGDHDFSYASADGETYDRRGFEQLLPFMYHRNMELWGLLPVEIDGQLFDRDAMRDSLQVFELKAREITDRRPDIPVYALLDAAPGRAGLSFPEDVFRMTRSRIEFIDVDVNRLDEPLTERFTRALREAGFVFPARLVAGRQTILKPFDAGVFLVDADGSVFHLRREGDAPRVTRTPIPRNLGIRHIKIVENARPDLLGLILADSGRLFLLTMPDYQLVALPTQGYDPDRMDYRLVVNPVNPTATFGHAIVHGVAMTPDFEPIADYARAAPDATTTRQARIAGALFPFVLALDDEAGPYLRWRILWNGWPALIGIALSLAAFALVSRLRGASLRDALPGVVIVAVTGVFGLIAVLASPWLRSR